jgi:hypothetical protein
MRPIAPHLNGRLGGNPARTIETPSVRQHGRGFQFQVLPKEGLPSEAQSTQEGVDRHSPLRAE